jgi:hypothetical protein
MKFEQTEAPMAASTEILRSLLRDVALDGAVIISKRKLLWLLGWGQDRKAAWSDLAGHWEQVEPAQKLHLAEVADRIVLALKPTSDFQPIKEWME